MLWQPDYDPLPAWQGVHQPAPGRVTITPADNVPGVGAAKPTGSALHARLLPGEGRAEVYARAADPMSGTPPEQWPDPVGTERWYGWSLLVPDGFVFTDPPLWLVCTQWKGYRGGSPPIAIEIKRRGLRLGGTRTNARLIPGDGALGAITPGTWTRLVVGLRLSADPATGWVEVWRDGVQALPRTAVATLDLIGGQPDPVYLKQGVYRDTAWICPHDLHFGPIAIGTARTDVA